jgi:hypothetical protein
VEFPVLCALRWFSSEGLIYAFTYQLSSVLQLG